jgi:hypothetical protein
VAQPQTTVIDPDGHTVDLTTERWEHITEGHPELRAHLDDVLATVRSPTLRRAGHTMEEQWFYQERVGPSRWLKVVVRYGANGRGWIVTAFARRSMP